MSPTIHEVAKAAGVSASTVSRAMSGGSVHPSTRRAILEVANRLGYTPNRSARGLTTGLTGNLGILVPDLSNPFFAKVIKGVAARIRTPDNALFVSETDEDVTRERETIESLVRNTDGLLLCSPRSSDEQIREAIGDASVVLLNRRIPGLPSVTYDLGAAAMQGVQHLIALGHRKIAYVTGPEGSWSNDIRRAAVLSAQDSGVEVIVVPTPAPTFASGVLAGDLVLTTGATAVIAFNDLLAIGVLNRLVTRGVRVPEEFSVVGHDDIDMASMCTPPLTTVAAQTERIGSMGADLLLRSLHGRRGRGGRDGNGASTDAHEQEILTPSEIVLQGSLTVRGSTAVVPPQ
ncbi:LacI family transcriptional regulator [Actinotalea sp. M2MS4P-6]|uniref:LacI family DNA-binding transcriptional regulator n=1 Tax=Actinotalea sp. M2MS4P-6 TaxID=2983762 RepID=UPI0021E47ADC|nr:LacI family DNA-binding transcriptional regulator [Actinotalea sp. M2MS4P-6]MCV2394437.1 LacI family transcriptional regulator [Actinotalea sp. M2MS4P-6]